MNGNDYSIIKAANRTLILNTIAEYGAISIMDIIRKIRLSRPTVENLIRDMQLDGIVEKSGTAKVGVGRSAQLYKIAGNKYFSIGIDLEFPDLRIVVINLKMETVYHQAWTMSPNHSVQDIIARMIEEIRQAISAAQLDNSREDARQLIGIGVGLCGQLDMRNKVSLNIERINGWRHVKLAEILQEAFDVPVSLRNDVHMMAMVNKEDRLKQSVRNYIYISLRSGIGMALFLKGELYTGMMGNAGFLGHTTVNYMGPRCRCGNHGCLETYLHPARLVQHYESMTQENISYDRLLKRFADRDEAAVAVMREAYVIFGKTISNLVKIVDVYNLVINGLPSEGKELLIGWIHDGIRESTLDAVYQNIHIEDEILAEADMAKGGAMLMIRKFFADPKLNLQPEYAY